MANPCAKTVSPENAYEVWQSFDGQWTYWVLKKYQSPEKEATNLYARWHCWVKSPSTSERGEYGDTYVSRVKEGTHQIDNPLCHHLCIAHITQSQLVEIGLGSYRIRPMYEQDERLQDYLKLAVPSKDLAKVKRVLEEHQVHIVCIDSLDALALCIQDVQSSEEGGTHEAR